MAITIFGIQFGRLTAAQKDNLEQLFIKHEANLKLVGSEYKALQNDAKMFFNQANDLAGDTLHTSTGGFKAPPATASADVHKAWNAASGKIAEADEAWAGMKEIYTKLSSVAKKLGKTIPEMRSYASAIALAVVALGALAWADVSGNKNEV